MKKFLLSIALLCSMCINAQTTITTQSSCDSNGDGKVDITDVTNTANKVVQKAAAENNVVTAEQLNTLLNEINSKLDELKEIKNRLQYLEKSGAYTYPFENGHEYVDMGLPSGTLWATTNVGADNPEDYGLYFAWGETTGYADASTRSFDWASYKYCSGSNTTITKYCTDSSYGTVDNKTELEAEDDAATANWGTGWCIPTQTQWKELEDNCTKEWTTMNSVNGFKITASNGNYIFLPAAGYYEDTYLWCVYEDGGTNGWYRSRTLYKEGDSVYSLHFSVTHSLFLTDDVSKRCLGRSVRPVRSK